jgi:hypothetical protein
MYHIDNLWPRECHEALTKNFACRPWMCKDNHFNHQIEEVWQALFGNHDKNKCLMSMVYAKLKLECKVDYSTFLTTMQYPLCIGKIQKHIPNMYNPESTMWKKDFKVFEKETVRG